MKLSKQEFLDQPRKSISLIGMSGVGKSHIASKLESWGWHNYSCDDLIGREYLGADDMSDLASFVGQIGSTAKGGLGLDEFKRRQNLYYEAECAVLKDMPAALNTSRGHFVNDSSGSLCEVKDESILEAVGQKTLFVYLRVEPEDHAQILARAVQYPKPLYFPATFFDAHLKLFQQEFKTSMIDDINPAQFLSWVFPHLFESRLSKYEALADRYGVEISARSFADVKSEAQFLEIIAEAL